MVNERPVISVVHALQEWRSTDADNQASGRAYSGAGAGGSLMIGQKGVWSAGGHLIIVVRVVHVL